MAYKQLTKGLNVPNYQSTKDYMKISSHNQTNLSKLSTQQSKMSTGDPKNSFRQISPIASIREQYSDLRKRRVPYKPLQPHTRRSMSKELVKGYQDLYNMKCQLHKLQAYNGPVKGFKWLDKPVHGRRPM